MKHECHSGCTIKEFHTPLFGLGLSQKKQQELKDFQRELEWRGEDYFSHEKETPYGKVKVEGYFLHDYRKPPSKENLK
jgi:hypothetical protein